jgi:hypothetical protein
MNENSVLALTYCIEKIKPAIYVVSKYRYVSASYLRRIRIVSIPDEFGCKRKWL